MYNYRAYDASWSSRNGNATTTTTVSNNANINGGSRSGTLVRENGTMGRHTSASPPPITIGDGKRRPIRDRLQNITAAMSWIKEELEGIKEQDQTLLDIFTKVQGDVKELNGFVANHRSSSSLQGVVPSSVTSPSPLLPVPQPSPPQPDSNLELDFDALDDDLSDSGEHKTSSLSGTPSPPLATRRLTDSGTSNLDSQFHVNMGGSRGNISARGGSRGAAESARDNEVVRESKDSTPGNISISLGSLDMDLDFPNSFGLGTITEGRSLMNIPTTTMSETSSYSGTTPTTNGGAGSGQKGGSPNLQRSVSHQPLQQQGSNLNSQSQKVTTGPKVAPKPHRRGSNTSQANDPKLYQQSLPRQHNKPPLNPPIGKVGRQTSETTTTGSERLSPHQARKEMMKSTPALFPSPPRSRRNTDSLPRNNPSKVMTSLLPFQAQQELREAANKVNSKKSSNGVIPHITPGSPILLKKGKQASPPLSSSSYRSQSSWSSNKSPKHNSPISSRVYPPHLSPGGMKGSSSMTRLAPASSYHSRAGQQEDTVSMSATMSRNSSMDSGIQYSSEGETSGAGGGATSGERASNTSTATTDSVATTTSLTSTGSDRVKGGEEPTKKEEGGGGGEKKGLGDFSDLLSVIQNMGGADSFFS